ncbi:AcrR family transcriptional regulator [Clostridium pascui]|uniref:TetR/AcrR family transcriptional regulator n=1 Tax=Clostridium pascui TaxID=46609 RepID=UPI00195A0B64|nr:TetR/AcrR family transcriptional regulator [Clostridium pascui]MBM7869511.1 AcrR family transcriptional regulator [Clostridium pascui]
MSVEIKKTAVNLFSKKGYSGTSVRDITKSLGITPAALYAHFGSKEELFLKVFAEGWEEIIKEVKDIIISSEGKPYKDILHDVYTHYVTAYIKDKQRTVFVLRNVMFPPDELREKVFDIFYKNASEFNIHMKEIFNECIEKGIIKDLPLQEHEDIFYKFVDCFLFEITAINKVITLDEIEKHWMFYWTLIENRR